MLKAFLPGRIEILNQTLGKTFSIDFNLFYFNLMLKKLPCGGATFVANPENYLRPGFYQVVVDQSEVMPPFLPQNTGGGVKYVNEEFCGIF